MMAVYKVIQDVEAEDKLLGPLTLKGFIYALIAGTCAFINFKLIFLGSPIKWLFIFMFSMPMILFGVLASPLGREQPTEVWLLSRLRFFIKPRRRVWDQEGINQLVTITAPPKREVRLTKDLSPNEVQSRLKTLASTLDTRGWAIKNVDVNLSTPEADAKVVTPESDRLIGGAGVPQQMPVVDVHASDDILDEKHNPTAQKFEAMMQKAEADRKRGLLSRLKDMVDEVEHTKGTKTGFAAKAAVQRKDAEKAAEQALLEEAKKVVAEKRFAAAKASIRSKKAKHSSKHPLTDSLPVKQAPAEEPEKAPSSEVTAARQTVNMELAQSGNAFSVATISQLANRQPKIEQTGPNEVTISLH